MASFRFKINYRPTRANYYSESPYKPPPAAEVKKWDKILQKFGHPSTSRIDTPPKNETTYRILDNFEENIAESSALSARSTYYRLLSIYNEHCNWEESYPGWHETARYAFNLLANGISYRDITKLLNGKYDKKLRKLGFRRARGRELRPNTLYWVYDKLGIVLKQCWLWHASHYDGELDEQAIETMQVRGLIKTTYGNNDMKVTEPLSLPKWLRIWNKICDD